MQPRHTELVRSALAAHLQVPAESLVEGIALEATLGLDPLDLVLVALRLEEQVGVEFPIALLEDVRTVGDLEMITRAWLASVPTSVAPFDAQAETFFLAGQIGRESAAAEAEAEAEIAAWWAASRRRQLSGWVAAAVAVSLAVIAVAWSSAPTRSTTSAREPTTNRRPALEPFWTRSTTSARQTLRTSTLPTE